jgi:hypothetical protein
MNVNKEKLLQDIKSINDAIAVMEHEKFLCYKSWEKSLSRKFDKLGFPFYIKLSDNDYMMVTDYGGGVCGAGHKDLYKMVTSRFILNGLRMIVGNDYFNMRIDASIGIDNDIDFITKEEFDSVIEQYFNTHLVPTVENIRKEYQMNNLENLLKKFPEYFDRPDVHFFIKRFEYIDEHMDDDNPDKFNEWL